MIDTFFIEHPTFVYDFSMAHGASLRQSRQESIHSSPVIAGDLICVVAEDEKDPEGKTEPVKEVIRENSYTKIDRDLDIVGYLHSRDFICGKPGRVVVFWRGETMRDRTEVTSDGLGDWRIDTVTTLAQEFDGAPVGTPVRLMSTAKHKKRKYLSFVTPSGSALCLNIAIGAAALSEAIRPRLLLTPMLTHDGQSGSQVRDESIADLYYFFEQSIISVTMSFQAIETFANSIIGRKATGNLTVKRKGGIQITLTPTEAERELSTEEKLGQILPNIVGVPCPRGNRAWQSFKLLKVARDKTVHLKSRDIYTRNEVDRESLFFYFLNHDSRTYPAAAIKVISHFFPKHPPRWLLHAREIAERDTKVVKAASPL